MIASINATASTTTLPRFPSAIHGYVAKVFGDANRRVSEKIARVPNCSEPSLDLTLVEHLTQYAGPRVVAPGWAVRLDVHYLGGLRHFHTWEVADIGILIFAKFRNSVTAQKVAVLQSKRLYPAHQGIVEETEEDYRIGFGTLLPAATSLPSIARNQAFSFSDQSNYRALRVADNQWKAIEAYEAKYALPVHYLLYNPWTVPVAYSFPLVGQSKLGRRGNGGCRVIPGRRLRAALAGKPNNYAPKFSDVAAAVSDAKTHAYGWRLEHFMSNLLLKCKEGKVFDSINEDSMFALFNRRSGPIAAAVAVTVEQFDGQ